MGTGVRVSAGLHYAPAASYKHPTTTHSSPPLPIITVPAVIIILSRPRFGEIPIRNGINHSDHRGWNDGRKREYSAYSNDVMTPPCLSFEPKWEEGKYHMCGNDTREKRDRSGIKGRERRKKWARDEGDLWRDREESSRGHWAARLAYPRISNGEKEERTYERREGSM